MIVKTYIASTLSDALQQVRRELGPAARVLSTEKRSVGFWNSLVGRRQVQVTALCDASLTSETMGHDPSTREPTSTVSAPKSDALDEIGSSYRSRFKDYAVNEQNSSLLESMIDQYGDRQRQQLASTLFRLFTEWIEAGVDDRFTRQIIEDLQRNSTPAELEDIKLVKQKAHAMLVDCVSTTDEIGTHTGQRRVVALIGPTGVGKTTTIAKLAANLRLRDKRRVGLITVDTYRIAAVDQLRAYADIIDLPMEVVTTPREMRDAVIKLSAQDIVLIDTAGRSPHDEIQMQELKAMLGEARADEVHVVLSSVAAAHQLTRLVENFRAVSPTSLLLTKLDEALTFGHLLPLVCEAGLPISYTTHGQNVPDDIQAADPRGLIDSILPN